jgi:carbon-monoxide dehydrogenase small subunit
MILSTIQLLADNPDPSEEDIRHGIAGNLCRCTGYVMIVDSIAAAGKAMRSDEKRESGRRPR